MADRVAVPSVSAARDDEKGGKLMGITGKVRRVSKRREMNTILEVCLAAAGGDLQAIPKAAKVCEFILEWAVATSALGHNPGIEEFGRWWKHSEKMQRTAYRRLALFRELFPNEDTPERFSALLLEAKSAQKVELSPSSPLAV